MKNMIRVISTESWDEDDILRNYPKIRECHYKIAGVNSNILFV